MGIVFSEMIFSHGFVHSDPHPGNVLINPIGKFKGKYQEFEIVLLDHGLYQVNNKFLILRPSLNLISV